MRSAKCFLWVLLLTTLFSIAVVAQPSDSDEDDSDITARVARISFTHGEAQVKRSEGKDWERAGQNLPLVEGDEITTGADARIEIQFSRDQFLRLAENSYLKITTLRDEGIAVSLAEGTTSIRVLKFDSEKDSFEIDVPKTTISIQKAGTYRIDAGAKDSTEVRVSVTDDGQARIYSEESGFILRNNRSTKIYLDDDRIGENETVDAPIRLDEWDTWVAERDTFVSKNLQGAHYDKYYDLDMYGAEDLDDYGEWIDTPKYGNVWRPSQSAIANYSDWSPYRYGQWRWIPPYGWTWVNDEPWGWATYHHGRWIYEDDYWAWTPYPQQRPRRSWWRPALVVITNISNDICWYPLPYDRRYRNYNSKKDWKRHNDRDRRPDRNIPVRGIITTPRDRFGNDRRGMRRATTDIANRVLTREPGERPSLPGRGSNNRNGETFIQNPRIARNTPRIRTGASERRPGVPLDGELRRTRVWGNRQPRERQPDSANNPTPQNGGNNSNRDNNRDGNRERRRTGIFDRSPRENRPAENSGNNNNGNSVTPPQVTPPADNNSGNNNNEERRRNRDRDNDNRPVRNDRNTRPVNSGENQRERNNQPPREERTERPRPPQQNNDQPRTETPRREAPRREEPRREERRQETPRREEPRREERRQDTPRREEPRREERRQETPRREEPRREERRQETPRREEPKRNEVPKERPVERPNPKEAGKQIPIDN